MKILPYSCQWISHEDIEAVTRVLKSDWLTQGPILSEFEKALAGLTGAKHVIAVSNGTAALYLACRALGFGKHFTGITSPLTFVASANCIEFCGGRADFVDVDSGTLCLDPALLEDECRKGHVPDVVIPVDFAGLAADLPEIWKLSRIYGFKIIEDAAHALGSRYFFDGKWHNCGSCTHSHLAIFSFHPVKNITSGEGGAILTNDDELAEKVRLLANHGIERRSEYLSGNLKDSGWYYEMQDISLNFRLSDIHAALGLSQLNHLYDFKQKRSDLAASYTDELMELQEHGLLSLPYIPTDSDPFLHLYVIRLTDASPVSRQDLYDSLLDKGIRSQVHYWPVHLQPYYRQKYKFAEGSYPVAEKIARTCLSIPLHPKMGREDVHRICKIIKKLLLK